MNVKVMEVCWTFCLLFITYSVNVNCKHLHEFTYTWSDVSERPVVITSYGAVEGNSAVSRGGNVYQEFRSIPYAKPPIGRNRFASPKELEPWIGVRNVSEDAPFCVQYNVVSMENFDENAFFGQEDCLYLSVFTHKADASRRRPVMVYIHGGGFESWTGARMHGPQYFMDHDLVTVFINYRLGPFGFLSTEDNVIPGNFGLKDQLFGLKWVRENIAKFGGDPDSITLFGESSGAASVHCHMKSLQSNGLFQRAILNSGTIFSPWALSKPGSALKRAMESAKLLGCSTTNSKAIINCLRTKPTSDIIKLRKFFGEWDTDPFVVFGPVLEKSGGFLTENDLRRTTNVTLLTGLTSQEGSIKVSALLSRKFDYLTQLMSEFDKWAPLTFGYGEAGQYPDISQAVRRHYFKDMDASSISDVGFLQNLTQAYSDSWFGSGFYKALKEHRGKLYRYRLDRRPQISFTDILGVKYPTEDVGASHVDDLFFLFNMTRTIPVDPLNHDDKAVSRIMVKLWSDFISNGAPGGIWRPTTDNELLVITTDGSFTMSKEYEHQHSVAFWHKLDQRIQERRNDIRLRG